MVHDPPATVRLHGHPGLLRRVAPGAALGEGPVPHGDRTPVEPPHDRSDVDRWLWEGAVDGPGIAAILRAAMVHGIVPCDVGGLPHRARAVACWYDAAAGTAVVELFARPEPLA